MGAEAEPRARKAQAALKKLISMLATRVVHLCVVLVEVDTTEVGHLPAMTSPGEAGQGTQVGSVTAR